MIRNTFKSLLALATITIHLIGCKKENTLITGDLTSLNIINAVNGSSGLIADINHQLPYFKGLLSINYAGYYFYSFNGGSTSVSLTQSSDTTHPLYTQTLNLPPHTIHSLFLAGTTDAPEAVLADDDLQSIYSGHSTNDSITAIRFINLSGSSSPISVNLIGNANGSEVSSLGYKDITTFRTYPATSNIADYTFEFRDASSGDILTTYTLSGVNYGTNGDPNPNSVRSRGLTIVFYGDAGAQGAFLVNSNYSDY